MSRLSPEAKAVVRGILITAEDRLTQAAKANIEKIPTGPAVPMSQENLEAARRSLQAITVRNIIFDTTRDLQT